MLFVSTVPITIETFLVPFAQDLQARGWRVEAAAAGLPDRLVAGDVFSAVHDVGFSRRALAPVTHLRALLGMRRLLRERRPDVVHLHTPIASALTRLAVAGLPRGRRPHVVYFAHGFHFYRGAPRSARVYEWLERVLARWTDVVFTINREDHHAAEAIFGGEVHLLPGVGIDLAYYAPERVTDDEAVAFRAHHGIGPQECAVLVVAGLEPGKRHERLIRALPVVGRPIVALFAGSGPSRESLVEMVEAQGLGGRVRFLGQLDDVRVALRAADCLALPSEREGLPRSVIEAMAMGTPVIGSDIRGIRDLLDGGAGVLVDTDDPVAFARAVDRLCADQDFRNGVCAAATRRVEALSEAVVLDLHGEVLERLDPRAPS